MKDHDRKLEAFLERCQAVGIKLNPKKMRLKLSPVRFMGHLVTGKWVQPKPDKVTAIRNIPAPTDLHGSDHKPLETIVPGPSGNLRNDCRQCLKVCIHCLPHQAPTRESSNCHYLLNESSYSKLKFEILSALDKEEGEINEKMSEVRERILELEELTNSRNVYNVSMYTSMDDTFEFSLAQLHVALPRFYFRDINREALEEQFGSLSPIYNVRIPEGASDIQLKALLDEPKFTQVMKTQYTEINKLRSVSSLKDDEMWTCGQDKVMRLYNLQGQVIRSYHTKSGEKPEDIAVMQGGDLLYSDYNGRTVHQVKDGIIETTISLRKWRPRGICSTASGDVLVIMDSDDQQSKVVRYSGSTEKHSIQWDDQDKPLLSPAGYTGPLSTVDESFDPVGIATDSQARILVADCDNHRIHILNQHGHFLRYIEDPDLRLPRGLCVDSRDTLLVAEATTGKVKKIQYNS
uniref:Uncharacterized protein LOC111109395 n=1 Tax=Crassostrea virginica TaxID=6565 RepID=A0A8B8BDA4_CRAVI|nr:uncharacterized protein LOC111109395 [Crassostrea virginica]